MKNVLITLVCVILTAHSERSFSQDSLCFSVDEAKIIFKLANKGRWCDTLSTNYEAQIKQLELIVKDQNYQIELGQELVDQQRDLIIKMNKEVTELKRKRGIMRKLLLGSGLIILVETGIILIK